MKGPINLIDPTDVEAKETMLKHLEAYRTRVESGEVRALGICSIMSDGTTTQSFKAPNPMLLAALTGSCAILQKELVESFSERSSLDDPSGADPAA